MFFKEDQVPVLEGLDQEKSKARTEAPASNPVLAEAVDRRALELDANLAVRAHRLAIAGLCERGQEIAHEAEIGFARLHRVAAYGSDDGEYDAPAMRDITESFVKVARALGELMPMPTFEYKEGRPIPQMPPRT